MCPCNMEEILEGRNLKDETFPQLFIAKGFEASPRLALEVQSSWQESGLGGMSVLGWKLSFATSSATVLSTVAVHRKQMVLQFRHGFTILLKRVCFVEKTGFSLLNSTDLQPPQLVWYRSN